VYFTAKDEKTNTVFGNVVRFTESNNKAVNEQLLISQIPIASDGMHMGGALAFGPDNKLYVSVGYGMLVDQAQNKSALLGKILRVNRDGTIPPDNPFANSPVYTFGHRNVYGIAFDDNGSGIITENGDTHYDKISLMRKGGNYGFPIYGPGRPPVDDNSGTLKPVRYYYQTTAPAQAIYYDGDKFPMLKGKYIVAMYNTASLHAITVDSNGLITDEMIIRFPSMYDNMVAVAQSPTGDIYFGADNIYKLENIDMAHPVPQVNWVDVTLKATEIQEMKLDSPDNNLSMYVTTGNSTYNYNNEDEVGSAAPSISIKIPNSILSGIFDVKSSQDQTADSKVPLVNDFKILQQYRTAHAEDTTILITMNPDNMGQIRIIGVPPSQGGTEMNS
jgi:hypothetical protein